MSISCTSAPRIAALSVLAALAAALLALVAAPGRLPRPGAQGDVGRAKLGEDRDNFQVQTMFLYLNVVPMFL